VIVVIVGSHCWGEMTDEPPVASEPPVPKYPPLAGIPTFEVPPKPLPVKLLPPEAKAPPIVADPPAFVAPPVLVVPPVFGLPLVLVLPPQPGRPRKEIRESDTMIEWSMVKAGSRKEFGGNSYVGLSILPENLSEKYTAWPDQLLAVCVRAFQPQTVDIGLRLRFPLCAIPGNCGIHCHMHAIF
jgi:hypothetical protein